MADWNDFTDSVVEALGHDPLRARHTLYPLVDILKERRGGSAGRSMRLGFCSIDEQMYFEWYAAHLYKGRGHIVEQGTWLGALTRALVAGVRQNVHIGEEQRRVTGYDLFLWEPYMDNRVRGTRFEGRAKADEDYQPLFEEAMGEDLRYVDIRREDLTTANWQGPIEFLLVDAMKNMPVARNILRQFFPAVLPEDGYIAHQDFLHPAAGWLQIAQYLLRDYYEPIFQVPNSDSVIFRCKATPPASLLEFPAEVADFPEELIDHAYEWTWQFISDEMKDRLAASKVWLYLYRNDYAKAGQLYRHYKAMGMPGEGLRRVHFHCETWKICDLDTV